MKQYQQLLKNVLQNGVKRKDRTGTGTISSFGHHVKYDLRQGFPLITTKKVLFKGVVNELLWFLSGSEDITELRKHTPIWNAWADENNIVPKIYGYQWRNWAGVDQIQNAINLIKKDPHSRRIIVSAWNVEDLPKMALPPCHLLFQFYVTDDKCLDLQLYQRSADLALGVPFNIASYALLMIMVAQECGLEPGIFNHTIGDAHIYLNHVEGVKEQLLRQPKPLPKVTIQKKNIFDITQEDIILQNYQHHPFIKFSLSV